MRIGKLSAIALMAASTISTPSLANAAAVSPPSVALKAAEGSSGATEVRWRGHRHHWRHRHHGYWRHRHRHHFGRDLAIGLGLGVAGALAGSAARGYYGYSSDARARCAARFRSFEWDTGLYTTYGGDKRLCPYLR